MKTSRSRIAGLAIPMLAALILGPAGAGVAQAQPAKNKASCPAERLCVFEVWDYRYKTNEAKPGNLECTSVGGGRRMAESAINNTQVSVYFHPNDGCQGQPVLLGPGQRSSAFPFKMASYRLADRPI